MLHRLTVLQPAVLLQMLGLYIILWVTLGLGLLYAAVYFVCIAVFGIGKVRTGQAPALLRCTAPYCLLAAGCSHQLRMLVQSCLEQQA